MVQRKILLGWELGAGLGHVIPLRRIGERLEQAGFQGRYAVQQPAAAIAAGLPPDKVIAAPQWTAEGRIPALPEGYAASSFGQVLGLFGIGYPPAMVRVLDGWDAILSVERPDAVLSDYAPGLNLAVRGRIPLLVFGSGYTVPPTQLSAFPKLWADDRRPYYNEDGLLAQINDLLLERGQPLLDRLPALMAGDRTVIATLAALDPYHHFRQDELVPPVMGGIPAPVARPGDEILCAARPLAQWPAVMQGLADLHLPGRIIGYGVDDARLARLPGNWAIMRGLINVAEAMNSVRMVIGYGGLGLTAQALAAGLPQLVIATDAEKLLNGLAVERLGIGRVLRARQADRETVMAAAAQVYVDPRYRDRALAVAREHEAILAADPVSRITELAQTLL